MLTSPQTRLPPFRQECLNENWFLSLADAEEKVESWRRHYNGERSHRGRGPTARWGTFPHGSLLRWHKPRIDPQNSHYAWYKNGASPVLVRLT